MWEPDKYELRPWQTAVRGPLAAAIHNQLIHFPIRLLGFRPSAFGLFFCTFWPRPKSNVFAIHCSLQSLSHISERGATAQGWSSPRSDKLPPCNLCRTLWVPSDALSACAAETHRSTVAALSPQRPVASLAAAVTPREASLRQTEAAKTGNGSSLFKKAGCCCFQFRCSGLRS